MRAVLTLLLVSALVYFADWSRAVAYLPHLSPGLLAAVFVAMFFGLVLSAWKWSYALQLQGMRFSFLGLLQWLCTGFFLNSFLPTAVGGDAYRVFRTRESSGRLAPALAAVAIERLVGFLALTTLGAVGALWLLGTAQLARVYLACVGSGLVALAGVLVFRRHLKFLVRRLEHLKPIAVLIHSGALLRVHSQHWPPFIALSFAFQLLSIVIVFSLFRDISSDVSLAQCAVIAACVGISAAAPFTLNGIGLMEGALVGAAVALGIDYDKALIVAIERRSISMLLSAACGLAYAARGRGRVPALQGLAQNTSAQRTATRSDATLSRGTINVLDVLNFTHDVIIIWEMGGRGILFWNQAAEDLYGFSREEVAGRVTHEVLQTQVSGGVEELETKIRKLGVWAGRLRHISRNGEAILVEGRLTRISEVSDRWLVLEVNRDLRDHVHAQATQTGLTELASLFRLHA